MLSADDLASARAALQESLTETATIDRPIRTPDGMGGFDTAPDLIGTVDCAVAPGETVRDFEGKAVSTSWVLTVPSGADIRVDDELLVLGKRFKVESVTSPSTNEVGVRLNCAEVPV